MTDEVVGPLLQKSEEGIFWHTQADLHQVFARLHAQFVPCTRPPFWSCWSDGEGREDETNVIHSQIYVSCAFPWSHDHGKVEKSQEISSCALENKILYI